MDDNKFRAFIIAALRRVALRWPARQQAKVAARLRRGVYQCASCGGEFKVKEIHMDHKRPVVCTKTGFVDWNTYIDRLFVKVVGYQALCKVCHSVKTKKENAQRRKK